MWVALSDLDLIITMIHNINSVVMEELKLIGAYYLYLQPEARIGQKYGNKQCYIDAFEEF